MEEEEHKYGLTYGFLPDKFDAMQLKIEELLSLTNLKEIWQERRLKMMKDKIDVTAFYVWFIENYPDSKQIMKESPNFQDCFR